MSSERVHGSVITNLRPVIWPEMALVVRINTDEGLKKQQWLFVKNLRLHSQEKYVNSWL